MRKRNSQFDHLPSGPGVYRIICAPTREEYVGAGRNMRRRVLLHFYSLARGDHWSEALTARYVLHGADAFRVDVLEPCPVEELNTKESAWFEKLQPVLNRSIPAPVVRQDEGERLIPKMLYLPQSVCDQIERYAQSEGRRFGNMGRRLVEEALEARRDSSPEPATPSAR